MDRSEAAALLGLDAAAFTSAELRAARNAALQAHHPDKAGTDPAAVRRATYWASRINEAFAVLEAYAGPGEGAQGQSFSAASARARARAARGPAVAPAAPDPEHGASTESNGPPPRGARAAPPPPRPSTNTAPAGGTPRATASAPTPAAPSRPTPRGHGRWIVGATIALALLVGGAYLVGSGATTQTPVAAALPSASSTPVASSPTPGPSASPISEAAAFYDALYAFDRASLQPCFAGGTSCDTAASVDYGDGVARTLGPEVIRLYELFRDNASPQFTATVCREERGAFFAYLAWLRGEVEVVGRTDAAGRAPQPVQRKPLRFEGCAKTTYDDLKARARELSTVLVSAQEVIASASDHLPDGDAATLAADGERLVTVGLDLARRAARDASFADVSAGAPEWVAMRAAAGDMVLAGMLLRDPSTATATSTKTLLRDVAAALEPVLKADPVRNWH